MNRVEEWIQRFGLRVGVQAAQWRAGLRRQRLLGWLGVDVLFDVGANVGIYAGEIRKRGYAGQIVSFEPLTAEFRRLEAAARSDRLWAVRNVGLGAAAGDAQINVSPRSVHSSLLPMAERYLSIFPEERSVGTEKVRIETLDSAATEFLGPSARVGVKIDVQGYELQVARGGRDLLQRAVYVESELLLAELYHGQARFDQLVEVFFGAGLRLAAFEPGHIDHGTGAVTWGDGIFVRDP